MNAGESKRQIAFTLIELLVIIVVVVMLVVLVFSSARRAKEERQQKQCLNNLKQVSLAFRQWSLGSRDGHVMRYSTTSGGSQESITDGRLFLTFQALSNELYTPKILVCPTDNRTAASDFLFSLSNTNISYFVGVDAEDTFPQMLLSGDRNITNGPLPPNRVLAITINTPIGYTHELHKRRGNVCLADGSVQSADDAILRKMIANTGSATNRLAMP